jgi:uncharacterized protein (TIGR03000 family)
VSYAQPQAEVQAQVDTRLAYLDVEVPADAVVYLQDQRMTTTGARRRFVTPPIVDGQPHLYTMKVVAQRGGQPVVKTSEVTLSAGQQVRVVVGFDPSSPSNLVASITPPLGR